MAKILIGMDEAGMGTLAGPMTAGVVAITEGVVPRGVRDSKTLTEDQREELAAEIMDASLFYHTGFRTTEQIAQDGMSNCWVHLMEELAILAHANFPRQEIILDGNRLLSMSYVKPVVKADAKYPAVSAASILAKHMQCLWMLDYDLAYPGYGFAKHHGYSTEVHLKGLKEMGACPAHRMGFKPVKSAIHSRQSR